MHSPSRPSGEVQELEELAAEVVSPPNEICGAQNDGRNDAADQARKRKTGLSSCIVLKRLLMMLADAV